MNAKAADPLKLTGALLFAIGALTILYRDGDEWSEFPLFIVLLVPFLILTGLALITADPGWKAPYAAFAVIFAPLVMYQFLDLINADTSSLWHAFWIFGLTAVLAAILGLAGANFAIFLSAVAGTIAFVSLLEQLFDPSLGGDRWIFTLLALAFAAKAWFAKSRLPDSDMWKELATVSAATAVVACLIGISAAGIRLLGEDFARQFGVDLDTGGASQKFIWDVLLLLVSVGAVIWAGRSGHRGLGYAGGLGILFFVTSVGLGLSHGLEDDPPGFLGWPLFLLLAGGAALAAGYSFGPGNGTATGVPATPAEPVGSAGGAAEPPA